jgi:predicted dehydrogenase
MNEPNTPRTSVPASRREFLKTTSVLTAGAVAGVLPLARSAHAAGSDLLKLGLIGCGGRGTGAAGNAMTVDKNTRLVAMADAFEDRLKTSHDNLKKQFSEQVAVKADHRFVGFDAYQQLLASDVDVVLLAEVPHFRPQHLKAAIDAGKHVFCEKPVAVDAPGIRSVLATSEAAAKKNLCLVSGLCWRYDLGVKETMKRILDGAIGDILAIQETYLTGLLWFRGHPQEWTEMEYQMRNWYYFAWLSGDHNVEQHIHSLDKASWAMRDQPPVRAWGLGGRQVRTEAKFGDIYDHHAVVYEYANGARVYSFCRQQGGCYSDVSDIFMGTKGTANILKHTIKGATNWRYEGPKTNMYDEEHKALFAAIRSGKPINNGQYMARSTMLAILGRMVDYTGQAIAWDQAINSKECLAPARYAFDAAPPTLPDKEGRYRVAMPGVTRLDDAKPAVKAKRQA